MKTCRNCKKEKPLKDFTKHYEAKDGISNTCKECTAKYQKEYQKNLKNRLNTKNYLPI